MKHRAFKLAGASILFVLMLLGCKRNEINLKTDIDLVGPLFNVIITDLTTTQVIDKPNATLKVNVGDKIELKVEAVNYNEEADNTIAVSLFDVDETCYNEAEAIVNVVVPKVDSGNYPATVIWKRHVESTEGSAWVGIEENEITMYIKVK